MQAERFAGEVMDDAGSLAVYGTDNSIYQLDPTAVVIPTSVDDLAALTRANQKLDQPFELVARGGGTGTNGQSLTSEIVVDMRRGLNKVLSIDVEAREAVVQPGVVMGELNAMLAPHGLFFAPHASTATRATIGGMVSTDAAGKGSLVHGRTNKHVLDITAVLVDGTVVDLAPQDRVEIELRAGDADRIGRLYRDVLDALDGLDPSGFPDVPRGFTGYNLAETERSNIVDFTRLLCGSEGTLALLGEIRVRLTPLPSERHLAVLPYPSFAEAVRDANRLKAAKPSAIECLDERTISMATGSPAWPTMATLLGNEEPRPLLLLEFDSSEALDDLRSMMASDQAAITSDQEVIDAVWKVRADAVGFLAQAVNGRRSVAFVEDCAVPPHNLDEFVAGFRAILDQQGLEYGMFGHADVGCIHVRPALDLYRSEHEAMIREISDEVAALVESLGGVLWGEHGRGFRGEYLGLSDDLAHRMRLVKTAFDPDNLLNPRKLYAPIGVSESVTAIDEVPLRVHRDRTVPEGHRLVFTDAFACNGNGICHHWGQAEVMCPSFKATLDPRLSPKGRADLLRAWSADPDDVELEAATADSLGQCLSCSACTGRCPLQVDIPEMKSRFLHRHPTTDRRSRLRDVLLSRFEALLPLAARSAKAAGLAQRIASPLLARLAGVVDLPPVPKNASRHRWPNYDATATPAPTVIILTDAFTAFLEPEVLEATLALLTAMGERPGVGPFVPSGKYDHVKGRRDRFAKAVARQRMAVEKLAATGATLVVIEPAVALLHSHEYPAVDPTYPSDLVESAVDFVASRLEQLPSNRWSDEEPSVVQLFQHCTEVSLAPDSADGYRRILEHVGFTVATEKTSCCGMAGVFGHEAENRDMSVGLFNDHWRPRMEGAASAPRTRCAPGYSCRSQAKRLCAPSLTHPLIVAAESLSTA